MVSEVQRQAIRADIRQRLVTALVRSGDAISDPTLARLPGPVRYRVTGALLAWDSLRAATDRVASPTLTEMLRSHGILRLTRYFDRFTRDLVPHGADGRSADALAGVAQYSAVWLAFEVRKGGGYEPTPPLHRVLDAAYIADDVPIGMLKMPTDTLCIIPEPARWKQAGDIEAIAIFKNERSIGFANGLWPAVLMTARRWTRSRCRWKTLTRRSVNWWTTCSSGLRLTECPIRLTLSGSGATRWTTRSRCCCTSTHAMPK
ncbi:hypothetical protein [Burkholderia multivorans]|uniref:hypothetical protein n=1 Tax=Burkholderia multivorans TaxID=87883 RepID=UPI00209FE054|nr:hypothetical protein [Burkholderia multivorans]